MSNCGTVNYNQLNQILKLQKDISKIKKENMKLRELWNLYIQHVNQINLKNRKISINRFNFRAAACKKEYQ